jgi:hypothetical protein
MGGELRIETYELSLPREELDGLGGLRWVKRGEALGYGGLGGVGTG